MENNDLLDEITNDSLFLIWLERCHLLEYKVDILEAIKDIVGKSKSENIYSEWNQLTLFE